MGEEIQGSTKLLVSKNGDADFVGHVPSFLSEEELKNLKGVTLLENKEGYESAYWIYTIKVERQDDFMRAMQKKGIMVSRVHERNDKHTCVKEYRSALPNLDIIVKEMICIPVGWWVTKEQREYIVECIKQGW